MKILPHFLCALVLFVAPAFANVIVTSPENGETVTSPAHYVARATTNTCWKGVASMGVYVENKLIQVVNGTSMDITISLKPGSYNTVVEEWDYCGGATFTPVAITVTNQTGVFVASPAPNSQVSSPANYVATANTTTCSKGVAAMGIYVNNQLKYVVGGASLNTQMNLEAGPEHTVVEEWDYCGGATFTTIDVNVVGGGNVLPGLQSSGGWKSWGQLAPYYEDCTSSCAGDVWSLAQWMKSPSISGHSTQFYLGGTTPYSDVLWSNPVIGQFSTQGLPDSNHTLVPSFHNFSYDAYFYGSNLELSQALEFDVNMYMNGVAMTWGHQCRIAGGNEWDIWDNLNAKWIPTGVPCNPISNGWNHVTIQVQREPDNTLLFKSITLNGHTVNINRTYQPFSVPVSWWGVTVNYQMDGDYKQSANTVFVDNFSLTYW